jgi:hypothetical protein
LPSLKGSVCATSKDKHYLVKIAKSLHINNNMKELTRQDICELIKERMLYLEKYNVDNITYVIIPTNHAIYPFPYNIHARVKFIRNKIISHIKFKLEASIIERTPKLANVPLSDRSDSSDLHIRQVSYYIKINNKNLDDYTDFLTGLGGVLSDSVWTIAVE